ncbi:TetR/AcrR family transcriptional regulator [Actinomadura sp. B10D3]|uniref:TetR/AcrR family transcriptional regulator n=1 Tax=Actinomadura sp. B10D3 TaxID=3153557 RepID=UPI00325F2A35
MPRQVDHDARRRQIAEALLRVAAARGLESASLREVAAEAGISIGRVQHYFASKDRLVMYATGRLRERIEERIRRTVEAEPRPPGSLRTLRAILVAFLPLDEDGRADALAGMAFFHRSLNDPELADRYRDGRAQATEAVIEEIRAAVERGEARPGLDAELEAHSLLALVGGLIPDLLFDRCRHEQALRVLDHQLERLSGGGGA